MKAITKENISELIGKTVKWEAPAYHANTGYHGLGLYGGVTKIIAVDPEAMRPIIQVEKEDEKSDPLELAFWDYDGSLTFSDGDRPVIIREVL